MSGGAGKEKHSVEIARKPSPVSSAFYELDQSTLFKGVKVALYRSNALTEDLCQASHRRPALTGTVVGMVRQAGIGGYRLYGYASRDKVGGFGYAGKLRLLWHRCLLLGSAAVRSGVIKCPKAAVLAKGLPAAFSMLFF